MHEWVVLLGDLFESWAGPRQATEGASARVVKALRALSASGVALAFVSGNRDFLFTGARGLEVALWPDLVRATWGGREVLLTHGDLLCTEDESYLRMRRVLRSPLVRFLARLVPYALTRRVAAGLRRVSRRAVRKKARYQMDLDYASARAWLEATGAEVLVAGHVHTGVSHRLEGPGRAREVHVLKDWEHGGSVVEWHGAEVRHAAP